tara:strand:+ start:589 stop:786 length:198 start_codon:yes stop_codon:yes gene_type:complete
VAHHLKGEKMIDYTIMEYDFEKRKYTTIGLSEGIDGDDAKRNYIEKHGWDEKKGIILFAKPPLCR